MRYTACFIDMCNCTWQPDILYDIELQRFMAQQYLKLFAQITANHRIHCPKNHRHAFCFKERNQGFYQALILNDFTVHQSKYQPQGDDRALKDYIRRRYVNHKPGLSRAIIASGDGHFAKIIQVLVKHSFYVTLLSWRACLNHRLAQTAHRVICIEDETGVTRDQLLKSYRAH